MLHPDSVHADCFSARGSADTKNWQRNNDTSLTQTENKEADDSPEIKYILINSYSDAFNEAVSWILIRNNRKYKQQMYFVKSATCGVW